MIVSKQLVTPLELKILFEKRKFREELSSQDYITLKKYKHAVYLSALIDGTKQHDIPSNYIASQMELELCYSAILGKESPRYASLKDLEAVVFFGLECVKYLDSVWFKNNTAVQEVV
jgi:hypothetical protein